MIAIAKPGVSKATITITVMLTTIMVILDMTIVNVALPNMMGTLGANTEEITWVLTSYIVVEAIMIPLTGFFVKLLGRKRLILMSIAGFMTASALCGQSDSLLEMVAFRLMQGFFGAFVVPLSQSIMVDTFDKSERGKAMAIWGIGIMVAPILGPTLGGYITQHLDWRWAFYINIPVGMLNLLMAMRVFQWEPSQKVKADWLGGFFMVLGIASLQIMLDKGNQENWFNSFWIQLAAMTSVLSLSYFIFRSWGRQDSIVNLTLLKDRNLIMSSILIFVFGLGLFGTVALQPIMLENLFHYTAETTGLIMAPRGLFAAIGMFTIASFINKADLRKIIATGFAFATLGTYLFTRQNLNSAEIDFIIPAMIQGFGMGMIFVPLSTLAYETMQQAQSSSVAGIYNIFRTLGSSVGISIATAILIHSKDMSVQGLSTHITPSNPEVHRWLSEQGMTLNSPRAMQSLVDEVNKQAMMVAFIDTFWVVMISFIFLMPLLFFIKNRQKTPRPG